MGNRIWVAGYPLPPARLKRKPLLEPVALPPPPPMDQDDGRYEEIDATLREVVKLFSERTDIKTVLEAGHATAELKSLCEARHKEIQQSIRGAATPGLCPAQPVAVSLTREPAAAQSWRGKCSAPSNSTRSGRRRC